MKQVTVQLADARSLPLADRSVDLVFGSPPYCDARTYGIDADRTRDEWVAFMVDCTREALRVSRGPVGWVVAEVGNTGTACDRLRIAMEDEGVRVLRSCIWTANKPPTNAGRFFSNTWEYILWFTHTWPLPHFSVAEIATEMKHATGGAFRQRGKDGQRRAGSSYPTHKVRKTMPNVKHVPVGGGLMGSPLACENEAPYPVGVVEYFALPMIPPGGTVCDPFSGSGTTAAVAIKNGRNATCFDIRQSQVELSQRRIDEAMATVEVKR